MANFLWCKLDIPNQNAKIAKNCIFIKFFTYRSINATINNISANTLFNKVQVFFKYFIKKNIYNCFIATHSLTALDRTRQFQYNLLIAN